MMSKRPGPCFAFQRGNCRAGDSCAFSHTLQFCPDFAQGECLRGDKCTLAHASSTKKAKPNFGLSGALAKDPRTGNLKNGRVVKWAEPVDSRVPAADAWRLYVFSGDKAEKVLYLHSQSAFLFGSDDKLADIHLDDSAECSKEHAVLQFRMPSGSDTVKPYIMDLESAKGTQLNGKPIDTSRYVQLLDGDVLTFGKLPLEFVLTRAGTSSAS